MSHTIMLIATNYSDQPTEILGVPRNRRWLVSGISMKLDIIIKLWSHNTITVF